MPGFEIAVESFQFENSKSDTNNDCSRFPQSRFLKITGLISAIKT